MNRRTLATQVRKCLRDGGHTAARLTVSGFATRAHRSADSLQPGFYIELLPDGVKIRYEPQPWFRNNKIKLRKILLDNAREYAATLSAAGYPVSIDDSGFVVCSGFPTTRASLFVAPLTGEG